MNNDKTLLFAARDGSYGDADGLVLVDATAFTGDHYERIEAVEDRYRAEATLIESEQSGGERIAYVWMTSDEAAEMLDTLEAAINVLIADRRPGLAEQVGDIRDVFARSGLIPTA